VGAYSAPPDSLAGSWGKGGERRDGKAGRGWKGERWEGKEAGGEGRGRVSPPNTNPGYGSGLTVDMNCILSD